MPPKNPAFCRFWAAHWASPHIVAPEAHNARAGVSDVLAVFIQVRPVIAGRGDELIFVVENTHAFAHDHNLFFLLDGGSVANFVLAASDQLADPRFVDLNAGELQLRATSPAIGSGTPLGYTRDYAGQPVSTPPDLGAFSFVH